MNKNEINRALGALQSVTGYEDTESIITEAESKYRGQAQAFRNKSLASLNALVAKVIRHCDVRRVTYIHI